MNLALVDPKVTLGRRRLAPIPPFPPYLNMRNSLVFLVLSAFVAAAQEPRPLPGTQPFTQTGDISAQMVEGIDHWLDRETAKTAEKRNHEWQEAASGGKWEAFVDAHREKLRQILGATDPR